MDDERQTPLSYETPGPGPEPADSPWAALWWAPVPLLAIAGILCDPDFNGLHTGSRWYETLREWRRYLGLLSFAYIQVMLAVRPVIRSLFRRLSGRRY